ncbi:GNAT family N-acetyltransferase [Phytomonospora endophytica]|uniref:GNAT superfamily N-acetyltransferase n=1 Tax=Phytomonospora endophytica TaxID=714109 RepID=A0A841FQV0_9ACTN|nr:GNAT family N-acetyltransferase [Phytomonospora endophytica]MBB6034340.1 GNAT superfamily N-acetyltransferase [Phytomonospora endophytica]GIG66733.1 hypothetical protein Pen01_30280 [Phytomonospora endophytica]
MTDPLITGARELWTELAGAPVRFTAGRVNVAVSPDSLLCPPGWAGLVTIGDAAVATAPDETSAARLVASLAALPLASVTDAAAITRVLDVADVLGPAALAYTAAEPPPSTVEELAPGDAAVVALEDLAGDDEAGEASLDEVTSPVFAIRRDGAVAAASGYRVWAGRAAHIGVLTAPEWRGKGLAKAVGAASTAHALAAGLLPQWRARITPSRRVALAIGFRELGTQLSVRLGSGAPGA